MPKDFKADGVQLTERWVCGSCGAVWWQPSPKGGCPSCGGGVALTKGELKADGSFEPHG
jgi:ribosomal protein S27AE